MKWPHIHFVIESLVGLRCCDKFTCWALVTLNMRIYDLFLFIKDGRSRLCCRLLYCIVRVASWLYSILNGHHAISASQKWTKIDKVLQILEQTGWLDSLIVCRTVWTFILWSRADVPEMFILQSMWMSCLLYKTEKIICKPSFELGTVILVTVWCHVMLWNWSDGLAYNRKFYP
jgi:hypothetical protein